MICCDGNQFQVPIRIKNKPTGSNVATGVYVETVVPTGVSIIGYTVPRGTYDIPNKKWTVGVLNPGDDITGYITVQITDKDEAPYTFEHTIASNQTEATPLDNTGDQEFSLDEECDPCDTPTASDDEAFCNCGYLDLNDTPCNSEFFTTTYVLKAGTSSNIKSINIDANTGYYEVEQSLKSQPWSFEYQIKCTNKATGTVTTYDGAEVTGKAKVPISALKPDGPNKFTEKSDGFYVGSCESINMVVFPYGVEVTDGLSGTAILVPTKLDGLSIINIESSFIDDNEGTANGAIEIYVNGVDAGVTQDIGGSLAFGNIGISAGDLIQINVIDTINSPEGLVVSFEICSQLPIVSV